jgi:hypothetical protein
MTSLLTKMIDYEQGSLEEDEIVDLFQALINNGMAWSLQGHYGRTAARLIEAGYCTTREENENVASV